MSTDSSGATKYCPKCKETKPIDDFSKDSKNKTGYQGYCRACMSAYQKEYYERTKEKRKRYHQTKRRKERRAEVMKKWREENPHATRAHKATQRAKQYGAEGSYTPDEWVELVEYYQHHCLRCLEVREDLEADHVIPLNQGGENRITNIQPLCQTCNRQKGTKAVDYRPRWENLNKGKIMTRHVGQIVVDMDLNREVGDSYRWRTTEHGSDTSLRLHKSLVPTGAPPVKVRVTVEVIDIGEGILTEGPPEEEEDGTVQVSAA